MPKEHTAREIKEMARARAAEVADATHKKKMRDANRAAREAAKGSKLNPQRKSGTVSQATLKAERNGKVARHRALKAGKTAKEAEAAYQASYKRAIAKHSKDDEEKIRLLAEAKEDTVAAGKGRTVKPTPKDEQPICGARRSKGPDGEDQGLCQLRAGWGTDHTGYGRCKWHGGSAPNGKISAEREKIAEDMVRREIQFYGEARDIDPVQALAEEVRRTAGHVAWLANEVRQLEYKGEGLLEFSPQGRMQNQIIKMYQDERDRLVKVSKVAIDAGVAERTIQLAEQQGQILATVIRDILWDKELELTPAQRQLSSAVVRRHLTALDAVAEPAGVLSMG